jgi:hypothetical protein
MKREQRADKNASFHERSVVMKKEIAEDNAAEEKRLQAELKKVKPAERDKEDQDMTVAATADLIGDKLRNLALWNKIPMDYVNVQTEWCIVNAPNSEKLILVQPTLVDAHVIDITQYRMFVDIAMEMVILLDSDRTNAAKPPHAERITELYEYRGCDELHVDEINLIDEYNGLITLDIDNTYILGVAIRYYTIPVTRNTSAMFGLGAKVEVVQASTGDPIANKVKMNTNSG